MIFLDLSVTLFDLSLDFSLIVSDALWDFSLSFSAFFVLPNLFMTFDVSRFRFTFLTF